MNASLSSNVIYAWGCEDFRVDSMVRKMVEGEVSANKGAKWLRYGSVLNPQSGLAAGWRAG